MVWAFYYQEDHARRCYKNYRFGWGKDASPNQHGQTPKIPHLKFFFKKKKKEEKEEEEEEMLARLKT